MLWIVIFLGIVLFFITVINPFVLLPIFIIGAYIEPMQYFPQFVQYNPTTILGLVMLSAWFFHTLIYKDFSALKSKQVTFAVFFVIWMVISSFFYRQTSMPVFLTIFRAIIPYFLFSCIIKTQKQISIIVWVLIICGVLAAVYGIHQLRANIGVYDRGIKRIVSFFSNPNAFGNNLSILIPILLGMFFHKYSAVVKGILLIFFAFLFAGIIISYSRGASVTFIAGIFLFVFTFFKKEKKVFAGIAAVFLLLAIIYFFPSRQKYTMWARVRTIFRAESAEQLDSGRAETSKAGIRMMLNNPLFGVGLGNFTNEYRNLAMSRSDIKIVSKHAMVAHNLYVEIGSQIGIVGLILYLLIVFFTLRDLYYSQKLFLNNNEFLRIVTVSLQVSVYVFLLYGFMGSGLSSKTFWIIISLAIPLKRMAMDIANNNNKLAVKSRKKL